MREPDCIVPSLCVELVVLAWSAAVCDPGLRSSFLFLHCSIADDLLFFPFEFRPDLMCHARTHTHTRAVCFRKLGETLGSQISSCMSGSGFTIHVSSYSNEIYLRKNQNKQENTCLHFSKNQKTSKIGSLNYLNEGGTSIMLNILFN